MLNRMMYEVRSELIEKCKGDVFFNSEVFNF